jgi:hypothetical protein
MTPLKGLSNKARVLCRFYVREKRLKLVNKARQICRDRTGTYMMTHVNNEE